MRYEISMGANACTTDTGKNTKSMIPIPLPPNLFPVFQYLCRRNLIHAVHQNTVNHKI